MITVDYREAALISDLGEKCTSENLVHGDVCVKVGDTMYIVERKTLQDLSASIKDGRFREQKSRLLEVYPSDKIIYIIERSAINKHTLPESTLLSAVLNLSLVHKFIVVHSNSVKQTCDILLMLEKKIQEESDACNTDYGKDNIGFTPIKKSSIVERNFLACQLATIPGVSAKVAMVIQEKFGTMKALIECLDNTPEILQDLLIGGTRKVGKSLGEKIIMALY